MTTAATLNPGTTLHPDGVQWRMHVTAAWPVGDVLRVEFETSCAATAERHNGRGAVSLKPTDEPGVWRDAREWPYGRWNCCPEFYRVETPDPRARASAVIGITGDLFA